MPERIHWGHLQDDNLDGDTYSELLAEFNADKAEYCRAVDAEGCSCAPHPELSNCKVFNHWCREHGVLSIVPAELTMSDSGIRGGEPCMLGTRVPVEQVSTLLEDGATWDFVKETYPSIPTPASGMPHTPAQEPPELAAIRERVDRDFVTDPGSVSGDLSKELMQARIDRRALLAESDRLRRTLAGVEEERDEYARKHIEATNRLEDLGVITDDDY